MIDYLFHRHYSVRPQVRSLETVPTVLLAEPQAEALAIYAKHLAQAGFLVSVCPELYQLHLHIEQVDPHLVILNPSGDMAEGLRLLAQIAQNYPALPLITIGSAIPDNYIDRLMATGVSLHINQRYSQPRDLPIAVKQVLHLS